MRNRKKQHFSTIFVAGLLAIALALLAVACTPAGPAATLTPDGPDVPTAESGQTSEESVSDPALLRDTEWWLAAIGAEPVEAAAVEPPVTLRFFPADGPDAGLGFNAHAYCNFLGGNLDLAAARPFAVDGQTDFECDPALAARDEAVTAALEQAAALRLAGADLLLLDATGETLLRYRPKPEPILDPALDGTEWILTTLRDAPLPEEARITLQFEEGQAGGNAGCNSYGAEIRTVDAGTFAVGEWAMTAMACEGPSGVMARESAYMDAFSAVTAYRLEDDTLTLLDQAGEPLLVYVRKQETAANPAALAGSGWRLATHNGDAVDVRRPITLIFGDTRYWGQSECRAYVGTYQAGADDIAFPNTSMLGEPCADEQLLLPPSGDYQFRDGHLLLTGPRGESFVYDPLTSESALPLAAAEWHLLAFIGPGETPAAVREPLPGTTLTASFTEDGAVRGSTGCNAFFGLVEATGNTISIADLAVTEEFCGEPEGIMEQEGEYGQWLEQATAYQSTGRFLLLDIAGNRALLFRAP